MLPALGFALVALYAGYVAYDTAQAKQAALDAPVDTGPDPVDELERINTELARIATQARLTLESAKEAVKKGV